MLNEETTHQDPHYKIICFRCGVCIAIHEAVSARYSAKKNKPYTSCMLLVCVHSVLKPSCPMETNLTLHVLYLPNFVHVLVESSRMDTFREVGAEA